MPREPTNKPSVKILESKQFYQFFLVTNNSMLNLYNRLITISQLANTNIQPCTSKATITKYVSKYITKPKKVSTFYKALAIKALSFINVEQLFKLFINKLINKLIRQRDQSTQKVYYYLLNLLLTYLTR